MDEARIDVSRIEIGDQAYVEEGGDPIGAVRALGAAAVVIWVENAGEFDVTFDAVARVHDHKVVLARDRLDARLREALPHVRDAEVPGL